MLAIDLPFPKFFDLSGAPLDAGYLYFGQPNQNPETAPITAYWDAAGTQPVLQPVRIANGLIIHNGAVSNLYVSGSYSMTIRDKSNALVFYGADSANFNASSTLSASIGSSLIGWIQSGVGAVFRLVQDKLRERVSVKDFGAIGDGVADDTAAIQAAITYVGLRAFGGTVFFPDGFYRTTATITVANNFVNLLGYGKDSVQIIRSTAFGPAVRFSKSTSAILDGTGIAGMRIIDNGANNATGIAIEVDNASRFALRDVTMFGGTSGLVLKAAANVNVSALKMYMQNSAGAPAGRYGIHITNTAIAGAPAAFGSNIHLTDVDIYGGDNVGATYSNLDDGIRVECVDGLWLNSVYSGGAAIADLHIIRTNAAYTCGDIFGVNNMLDICRGNGLLIDGTQFVTKVLLQGDISCAGTGVAAKDGVYITGPVDGISLAGGIFGWKGNGLLIGTVAGQACTNINVSGMNINGNTGYGIQVLANTGTNLLAIVGNNVTGNTTGSINDLTDPATTTKTIESNLGYSAPWLTYVPVISAATGAVTGVATGRYKKIGNLVHFQAKLTTISADTGTGYLIIGLPSNAGVVVGDVFAVAASETSLNFACTARVNTGATTCFVLKYDGTYPSAIGRTFVISGTYQVA